MCRSALSFRLAARKQPSATITLWQECNYIVYRQWRTWGFSLTPKWHSRTMLLMSLGKHRRCSASSSAFPRSSRTFTAWNRYTAQSYVLSWNIRQLFGPPTMITAYNELSVSSESLFVLPYATSGGGISTTYQVMRAVAYLYIWNLSLQGEMLLKHVLSETSCRAILTAHHSWACWTSTHDAGIFEHTHFYVFLQLGLITVNTNRFVACPVCSINVILFLILMLHVRQISVVLNVNYVRYRVSL